MAIRPIVLPVDDDPSMREMLARALSLDGRFRVVGPAADGFEAAMLAADLPPDVVVLDFFMPRWDGCKAAEFIRRHCPGTKIIAFSSVLAEAPHWADEVLMKTDISRLVSLVQGLAATAA